MDIPAAPTLLPIPSSSSSLKSKKPSSSLSLSDEVSSKIKRSEDKDSSTAIEAISSGHIPVVQGNMQTCAVCLKDIPGEIFDSHVSSHPNLVVPGIYLGGQRNAANFEELTKRIGVQSILNCAIEVPNYYPESFHYLNLPLCVLCT